MLGHMLVRSHYPLVRLFRTACFAYALHCSRSLTHSLPSLWENELSDGYVCCFLSAPDHSAFVAKSTCVAGERKQKVVEKERRRKRKKIALLSSSSSFALPPPLSQADFLSLFLSLSLLFQHRDILVSPSLILATSEPSTHTLSLSFAARTHTHFISRAIHFILLCILPSPQLGK